MSLEEKIAGLAERLRIARAQSGLGTKEVAERTDIEQRMVKAYENGVYTPPAAKLLALANCFNVSVDYLLGRVDHPLGINPGMWIVDLEEAALPDKKAGTWAIEVPPRYAIVRHKDKDALRKRLQEGER